MGEAQLVYADRTVCLLLAHFQSDYSSKMIRRDECYQAGWQLDCYRDTPVERLYQATVQRQWRRIV